MRIGLVYDLFDDYPWREGEPADADAEYEPEATVEVLEAAIAHLGHEPVRIGTARDLLRKLPALSIDAAVNIAEGAHSRNREAYVPVLLEMAGIPFVGSDALTLSLSLDKAWTKDLVAAAGVPVPSQAVYRSPEEIVAPPASFPLFVKPRYEGSSKGITAKSRVSSLEELRHQVAFVTQTYGQDALVEPFVHGGGEFTVCVVGNGPARALPVLQRAVEAESRIGLHALEHRGLGERDWPYVLEGTLTPDLEARLQELAVRAYDKIECRDFARVDFRVDADGQPWFIEINPLPTFAPDGTFAIVAELMGLPYPEFMAQVLGQAFRRLGIESSLAA